MATSTNSIAVITNDTVSACQFTTSAAVVVAAVFAVIVVAAADVAVAVAFLICFKYSSIEEYLNRVKL